MAALAAPSKEKRLAAIHCGLIAEYTAEPVVYHSSVTIVALWIRA
jgi:hypothetical protein